jgi:hypothetical protein
MMLVVALVAVTFALCVDPRWNRERAIRRAAFHRLQSEYWEREAYNGVSDMLFDLGNLDELTDQDFVDAHTKAFGAKRGHALRMSLYHKKLRQQYEKAAADP